MRTQLRGDTPYTTLQQQVIILTPPRTLFVRRGLYWCQILCGDKKFTSYITVLEVSCTKLYIVWSKMASKSFFFSHFEILPVSTKVEDSKVAGRRCLHFPGRRLAARRHGGDEQGKKWSGNILLSVLIKLSISLLAQRVIMSGMRRGAAPGCWCRHLTRAHELICPDLITHQLQHQPQTLALLRGK